ncbi:hypothetical protein VTJ04DRAFT_7787 [Mycothermus thermophilus]|uniref:uncharacterized protein n=1 Tax=Humicola insolens TaxID=85995 RepID=UPI003741EFC5
MPRLTKAGLLAFIIGGRLALGSPTQLKGPASDLVKISGPANTTSSDKCISGYPPAGDEENAMHGYAILDYARIRPGIDGGEGKDWVSYKVEPEWSEQHYLSGPHSWMRYTHYWDPIGPWKCQFLCKADKECASFFAWYVMPGTKGEHMLCVLFDAVVPPLGFVKTEGTIASGAYDYICKEDSSH